MSKWLETELNKIGNVVSGGTPSTSNTAYWEGDILFVTPYDLSRNETAYLYDTERKITKEGLENSSATLLPVGSIIISSRAPIGYIAIGKKEFTTNQGCKSVIPYSNFDSLYLYYCFNFYIERIKKLGAGSTFAEISKTDLETVKFPHPEDKKIQEKIAQILSTADAVIEKTQAAIVKYKAIKQGMLHDLFTRGVDTATGELRPRYEDVPELYNMSKSGWVPKDWITVEKLGEHIKILPGFPFNSTYFNSEGKGLPLIRIRDLIQSKVDTYFSGEYEKEYLIKENDILIGMDGDFHIVRWQNKTKALLNQRIMKVAQKENSKIDIEYFYFFLFPFLKDVWEKTTATTVKHLSTYDISDATYDFPLLTEQKLIAGKLKTIDNKLQTEQNYLLKIQQLKAGLMSDLLSGKKRVKV